jgi:tRNA-dihydrouridine synthase
MIHGRALNQGHSGPVDFAIIKKARQYFPGIILANGGVKDRETAAELLSKTGADGIGIGQGALGRPWIFRQAKTEDYELQTDGIFTVALKQADLAYELKGRQGIIEMRKHLCWYAQGLPGAKEMRGKLVKVESLSEIKELCRRD